MKYMNMKKLTAICLTGFILLNTTGCSQNNIVKENTNPISIEESINQKVNANTTTQETVAPKVETTEVIEVESLTTDEKAVTYFETANEEVDQLLSSDKVTNAKEKTKEYFIKMTDFIFYGTEINGVTFNELSDEAKAKVVALANAVDTKIESKYPDYKLTIKTAYSKSYAVLSSKLHQGITYLDDKIEEKIGTNEYDIIKDKAGQIKDNAVEITGDAADATKELYDSGKQKIKSWYENLR